MSDKHLAHEYIEWSKQKLDEIDATLLGLDKQIETLTGDARTTADRAVADVLAARDAFKAKVEALRADVPTAEDAAADVYAALDQQWGEVELAVHGLLSAVAGRADVLKAALKARADAQRKAMRSSFQAIRANATEAIDRARGEVEAALHRITAEAEKVEAKLGQVSAAGGDTWKAIKGGLADAKSVHEKTWKAISDAISRNR